MRLALVAGGALLAASCGRLGFDVHGAGDDVAADASHLGDGAGPDPLVRVAAGHEFTVALRADGSVWVWGEDDAGQLADGAAAPSGTPRPVGGLPSDVVQIAAGFDDACARTAGGALYCWGNNGGGQLGLADDLDRPHPTAVPLPAGLTALTVTMGNFHTCAILSDHAAWCWGANDDGEVGSGPVGPQPAPITRALADVVQLSAGADHTCAVTSAGVASCWGQNDFGELGVGDTTGRGTPTELPGLAAIAVFAGQRLTCALDAGGHYACWGVNDSGQRGDGTFTRAARPPAYSSEGGFVELALGDHHVCGRRAEGTVACWGGNDVAQLGLGEGAVRTATTPQALPVHGVLSLAAGDVHTCVARADASVACWGSESHGQLGDGVTGAFAPVPVPIPGAPVSVLAVGDAHACVLAAGLVYCWGAGDDGEIGDGSSTDRASPTLLSGMISITDLTAGAQHTCALKGQTPLCWGAGADGELGDGSAVARATPVAVGIGAATISAGGHHTCARESSAGTAKVLCWGAGDSGELGDGSATQRAAPVAVTSLLANAVAAGGAHTCSRLGGNVQCWGNDHDGQLGDGALTNQPSPVDVGSNGGAVQLALGAAHSCMIDTNQAVECWGNNGEGELGTGDFLNRGAPNLLAGIAGAVVIAAGNTSTCAATPSQVACWGGNAWGQLATGDSNTRTTATAFTLPGPASPNGLGVGAHFACALTSSGAVFCWGDNARGQLGIGRFGRVAAPLPVAF